MKSHYEDRLFHLPDTNIAHQTLVHVIYTSWDTRWVKYGLTVFLLVATKKCLIAQVQDSAYSRWRQRSGKSQRTESWH